MIRYSLWRPLHISWIVAIICVGIVIGVVWAREFSQLSAIAWLLTGTGACLTAALGARVWLIPLAVIGGILIGLWRGSDAQADLVAYRHIIGKISTLQGVVSEDIDRNRRGQSVLRMRDIRINGMAITGSLWVTTSDKANMRRSDIVTVHGQLNEGFGNFAASMYSARVLKVERPVPGDIALQVRDYFATGVQASINEPEASLGMGYLAGQRRGLPEELDVSLQAAGLTHIVVASGYNLTILVRLARRLFENISKYLSFLAASGMIVSFIAVTGLSPSMSRAGLVAGLSLLAWYYGRRFHPLVLLPLAMAITLLIQPSYAWGDLGWQLSFAAFGGVMILAPLLQAYLFGDKSDRALRRIFIETMAAMIATLPILLASFGQFSLIAPIANMAILPLVPLAMLLTFLAGIGGLAVPIFAGIVGFPAQLLLTYMTTMAQFMGGLPWAVQDATLAPIGIGIAYAVIAAVCIYMQHVTRYNLRDSSLVE